MTHRTFRRLALTASALVLTGSIAGVTRADFRFNQVNLVSDTPGLAAHTDPNLINPWGISSSPAGPFWVSNQGSGTSTLYNSAGVPQSLVVTVPQVGASPPHGPTGQVFNNTTDFALSAGGKALFLFTSLDGSISGWNASKGTTAEIKVTPTSPTTYTGLAAEVYGPYHNEAYNNYNYNRSYTLSHKHTFFVTLTQQPPSHAFLS